jgi:signal transduction histidine kinase
VASKEKINGMMIDVDRALQSIRKISTDLRPGILDTLGLIPAIEFLVKEFEKITRIKCGIIVKVSEQKFEKNISICFFRICQEALINILKHAAASEVNILVSRVEDELILKISDNGKGIADEKLENPFSLGLLGMRERANIIGADLQIVSKKDFGTTISLQTKLVAPVLKGVKK